MRIAIVMGSLAPVPPVRPVAPAIVLYNIVESLPLHNIRVFSHWEPKLDEFEYDCIRYKPVKPYQTLTFFVDLLYLLPYRVYHPLISKWVQPTCNKELVKYALTASFGI